MAENDAQKGRWKHWKHFGPSILSYSYAKLGKRAKEGICIGCGRTPCDCKNRDSKKKVSQG